MLIILQQKGGNSFLMHLQNFMKACLCFFIKVECIVQNCGWTGFNLFISYIVLTASVQNKAKQSETWLMDTSTTKDTNNDSFRLLL